MASDCSTCLARSSVPTPPCQTGREVAIYMHKCNLIDKSGQIRYAEKKGSSNVYNRTENNETQNAIAETKPDATTKCLATWIQTILYGNCPPLHSL
jgi:hypothetical protein